MVPRSPAAAAAVSDHCAGPAGLHFSTAAGLPHQPCMAALPRACARHRCRSLAQPPPLPSRRAPAGTVCVLGVAGPRGEAALQRVVQRYSHERQYTPKVFRGSSAGTAAFGHLRLRRREGSAPSPAGPSA